MPNTNTLSINNVECARGERTLFKGLNAQVSSGQCLHVIGENGCGKTSLLRIISGLNTPDNGVITFNNSAIKNNTLYLRESAFIGHKDALKNELSAIENLRFYQQLNKPYLSEQSSIQKSTQQQEEKLDECLAQLKVLHSADLLAQQLSFGQRRRLAFAKLLLKPYHVWILDEPFTGIDTQGRQIIEHLCMNHLENNGLIVLTHHQNLGDSVFKKRLTELELGQFAPSDDTLSLLV